MKRDLDVIQEFCAHTDPRLRGNAMSALVSIGSPDSLAVFAQTVEKEEDPEVLRRALESVAAIGSGQAEQLARGLPDRLDDPVVGPVIYNLLARVRAAHPDTEVVSDWPWWRRLIQAWRTRRLPVTLAPRAFQWRSARLAFVFALVLAPLLAAIVDPPPWGTADARRVFVLALATALLAASVVLTVTRSFYGSRFHLYRFTGLLVELARTAIAGVWILVVIVLAYGWLVRDFNSPLTWSVLLGLLFVATTRLGVAIGAGQSGLAGSRRMPDKRWDGGRRVVATLCGALLTGSVITAVCAGLARSGDEGLRLAASVWWLMLLPSAFAVSWGLSQQEEPWTPARRHRRPYQALFAFCVAAGLLPALVLAFAGWEVVSTPRFEFDKPLGEGDGDAAYDRVVSSFRATFPFEVSRLSEVTVEVQKPREEQPSKEQITWEPADEVVLQLRNRGGRVLAEAEGQYESLMSAGRYEAYVDTAAGLFEVVRRRLGRLSNWSPEVVERESRQVSFAGVAVKDSSSELSLGLGEGTRYLLPSAEGRVEFPLEDQALVDFVGRAPMTKDGRPSTDGEYLTVSRQEDDGPALGKAEDLTMRRILERGTYWVELSSADLVLQVTAFSLSDINGDAQTLEPGTTSCWRARELPTKVDFLTEETVDIEFRASEVANKTDIALVLKKTLPDPVTYRKVDGQGDTRGSEILSKQLEKGTYEAWAVSYDESKRVDEGDDVAICLMATAPEARPSESSGSSD